MEVTGTRATIGSDAWKNVSIRNIRLSHTVVNRSDNARIHAYVRGRRSTLECLNFRSFSTHVLINFVKINETMDIHPSFMGVPLPDGNNYLWDVHVPTAKCFTILWFHQGHPTMVSS